MDQAGKKRCIGVTASDLESQKRMLILEDNELSTKLYAEALHRERSQYRVDTFKLAADAFEFAMAHRPDVFHVDCMLPVDSGFQFIT